MFDQQNSKKEINSHRYSGLGAINHNSKTANAGLIVMNQTAESRHSFAGQNKPACRALRGTHWLGGIQIAPLHSHAVYNGRKKKAVHFLCDVPRYKCNTAPSGSHEMISSLLDLLKDRKNCGSAVHRPALEVY